MPFPQAHNYLQVFGTMDAGTYSEIWSFGIRIGKVGSPAGMASGAAADPWLDDVKGDLTTWWTAIKNYVAPTTKIRGMKLNAVGVDGRYVSTSETLQRDFTTAGIAGTAPGESLPTQCTVVASLLTNTARGLASRGRIFLPPMAVNILATGGLLYDPARDALQTHTTTLLNNLNNWPGLDAAADPGDVVICSAVGAGAMRKVTSVSVGSVIDTQRRRRNNYREARTTPGTVS